MLEFEFTEEQKRRLNGGQDMEDKWLAWKKIYEEKRDALVKLGLDPRKLENDKKEYIHAKSRVSCHAADIRFINEYENSKAVKWDTILLNRGEEK